MKSMKMKYLKNLLFSALIATIAIGLVSCSDDDMDEMVSTETGMKSSFTLGSVANAAISGSATFAALEDGSVKITLDLSGTPSGGIHPAHIHDNTAVEGGGIAISLEPVDGTTGMSETIVTAKDDGTAITYEQLLTYDGYINVHLSADDLGTLVAQGDIGQNILTGESTVYNLGSVAVPSISGTLTLSERVNSETLAIIELAGTPDGGSHPAHIHMNTAAEGGGIAISFNPVMGGSGMSKTNIASLDGGAAITYEELLDFDGYVNVHLSADDLGTLVAQGDIGQNILTGESTVYNLGSVAVPTISGTITLRERVNSETLAIIELTGTPDGGSHPAHIHMNTAAEGGGIAISFNPVMGGSGMSKTNIAALNDGAAITYEELLDFDGYVNVHLSADDLGTLVAQGDIGQNILTGVSRVYNLGSVAVPSISGTLTLSARANSETLAIIALAGTPEGGSHPAHIHMNTAAEGGGIAISFNPVMGGSGMSKTNIAALNGGAAITYEELLDFDGYVNVHLSADDLGTIVAQGDIGQNALTGMSKVYMLNSVDVSGVTGNATFYERVNGETLVTIALEGIDFAGDHPSHIHSGTAAVGGGILITLSSINAMGMSKTNVSAINDMTAIDYAAMTAIDGYINVHLSASDLGTLVAQGNVGANAN